MAVRGERILQLGRRHIGEPYVLGSLAPKNNSKWKGPWDCAEFASWLVFQAAGVLYGCASDSGDPASADAYTGDWARDAETLGVKISVDQAMRTPGATVLRRPQPGAVGHIVISDGRGGTVEAHSAKAGVIASTVSGRRWDMGILIPADRATDDRADGARDSACAEGEGVPRWADRRRLRPEHPRRGGIVSGLSWAGDRRRSGPEDCARSWIEASRS